MKSNDPLLLEIQDEISRENMVKFVNKYGKLLIALGLAIFTAIAAYQFWEQYRTKEAAAAGSKIYKIMSDTDKPQDEFALKTLDATSHTSGYYEISLLNKAYLQIKNNNFAGAITSYDNAAKNGSNKSLRDLAALNAANLLLNTNPKAEGLEKRLIELTIADNSYKYNALELLAAFYIQNNNQKKGVEILAKLAKDPSTPVTISKRARELSSQLSTVTPTESDNEEE